MSLYSFPFTLSLWPGAESTHQCLLERSIEPSPSQHVLRGKERGKRAICLEQHSLSCTKNAETERRGTDLCEIHSGAPHDGHDGL